MSDLERPVRWGFLGVGAISRTVAQEVGNVGNIDFQAAFGRDRSATKAFAEELGFARSCDTAEELIGDADVDAIYIALPHSLHVDFILKALDAGKHVLCEKPLGMSSEEVERVASHPAAARMTIGEGFMVRHHPQWRWVIDTIRSGRIGAVHAMHLHSCLRLPQPANPPALPGQNSLLLDIGCYSIHLARAILGEPQRVTADLKHDPAHGRDIEISARLVTEHATAHIFVSGRMNPARRIHIIGTDGAIEMFNPIHPSPDGTTLVRVTTGSETEDQKFDRSFQYGLQLLEFGQAIREGRQPLVSLNDALMNARVLDAIKGSSASGGHTVEIGSP